jgi:two-component system chemotaxis sensor kinase CheA
MSALLDQFVDEAGDLLESAGSALLVLERNPSDASAVNDLFRSVHTLKGTSALFEFPAFTKLVHAGEDLLDCVREGSVAVSPELVDVQLEVLDLLRAWIDSVRDAGALPDDAANRSRELLARLTELKAAVAPDAAVAAEPGVAAAGGVTWEWLAALPEDDRVAAFRAADDGTTLVAIEYTPDPDCYFRGEDPLFTCRGLPDVLAFGITVVGSAIPLAEFDPYVCRMRFVAITSAPQREIDHLFRSSRAHASCCRRLTRTDAVLRRCVGSSRWARAMRSTRKPSPDWCTPSPASNASRRRRRADPGASRRATWSCASWTNSGTFWH